MHTQFKQINIRKFIDDLKEKGYFLLGEPHYAIQTQHNKETISLFLSYCKHKIQNKLISFVIKPDPGYSTEMSLFFDTSTKMFINTDTFLKEYGNRYITSVMHDIKPSTKFSFKDTADLADYVGRDIIYSERVQLTSNTMYDKNQNPPAMISSDAFSKYDSEDFTTTVLLYKKYLPRTNPINIEKLIYLSKCDETQYAEIFDSIICMPLSKIIEAIKPRIEDHHYSLPILEDRPVLYRRLVKYNPISIA